MTAEELAEHERVVLEKSQNLEWWIEASGLAVKNKDAEEVPYRFNEAQRIIHGWRQRIEADGYLMRGIILKARQEGCSTYWGFDQLHTACTKTNRECYMILQDLPHAEKLFAKTIESGYLSLDPYFKPGQLRQSLGRKLQLDTGSQLFVDSAQNKGSGRSGTLHKVHATEMPEWPNADKTITGLTQAVPRRPGTTIVFESTAQGMGDWFHREWKRCIKAFKDGRTPPYWPLFLPWAVLSEYEREAEPGELRAHPLTPFEEELAKKLVYILRELKLPVHKDALLRKILWRRSKLEEFPNEDDFRQEYPLTAKEAFLSSGRPYFPGKFVESHRERVILLPGGRKHKVVTEPVQRMDVVKFDEAYVDGKLIEYHKLEEKDEGRLMVWRPPTGQETVVIPGDIATLEGEDHSAAHVLNVDGAKLDQLAVWHGDITPTDFGVVMAVLGKWFAFKPRYQGATPIVGFLAPELNNHGGQTIVKLNDGMHYPRIYHDVRLDTTDGKPSHVAGFPTNQRTRPMMLDQLLDYIQTFDITLRHEQTLDEIQQFALINGRPQAPSGEHDDLVMALAIGIYVRAQAARRTFEPVVVHSARY